MTPTKTPGVYEIDVTRFMEDKATFYTLSVSCPPGERSILAEAKYLGIAIPKEAEKVIRDGTRFVALPKEETNAFSEIRSRARRQFQSYSIYFPFLPPTVIAVAREQDDAFRASMSGLYSEFAEAVEKLCNKLDKLKAERFTEFVNAGDALYSARQPRYENGNVMPYDVFMDKWRTVFVRSFPTRAEIQKTYRFRLDSAGQIRKTLNIATREEFLADEATKAKHDAIKAMEAELRAEFFDFAAAAAVNLRVGLIRALEPIMNGGAEYRSLGMADVAAIEKHVEAIRRADVFGDKTMDELLGQVKRATDTIKAGIKGVEKARAETKLAEVLEGVKDSLVKECEFEASRFSNLELDGSDDAQVFADKDVLAGIREAMQIRLAEAVREVAEKCGKSPDERAAAEERLRREMAVSKAVEEGADESIVTRATNIEV